MYESYRFNKDECEKIIAIIDKATEIWTKDLPPLLCGTVIEEIEKITDRMFEDNGEEIGKIDCELAIKDIIIPAVKVACKDLRNKELKTLLSNFVCDFDGSTLYKVLESEILKKEAEEMLSKSYNTREMAVAVGMENPTEYYCWECGKKFWAEWRSKYSSPAICPICQKEVR